MKKIERQPEIYSNQRKRAELAYREYRAIMILANRLVGDYRQRVDRSVDILPKLPRPRLHEEYSKVRKGLAELRRELGAKASLSEYEKLLSDAAGGAPERGLLFVPKYVIQQHYFHHYERVFPLFASLPAGFGPS
jgi:hypothetical protein